MTAAEKLRAWADYSDLNMPSDYIDRLDVVTDALPALADVVEAAEPFRKVHLERLPPGRIAALDAALSALNEVLK